MNYRNCIPTKRFDVGETVYFLNLNPRTIIKVLKKGYEYKDEITGKILNTLGCVDPYMIFWGDKEL
jgi:hypothetical protein